MEHLSNYVPKIRGLKLFLKKIADRMQRTLARLAPPYGRAISRAAVKVIFTSVM